MYQLTPIKIGVQILTVAWLMGPITKVYSGRKERHACSEALELLLVKKLSYGDLEDLALVAKKIWECKKLSTKIGQNYCCLYKNQYLPYSFHLMLKWNKKNFKFFIEAKHDFLITIAEYEGSFWKIFMKYWTGYETYAILFFLLPETLV